MNCSGLRRSAKAFAFVVCCLVVAGCETLPRESHGPVGPVSTPERLPTEGGLSPQEHLRRIEKELATLETSVGKLLAQLHEVQDKRTAAAIADDVIRVIQTQVLDLSLGQALSVSARQVAKAVRPELLLTMTQAGLVDTAATIILSLARIYQEVELVRTKMAQAEALEPHIDFLATTMFQIIRTTRTNILETLEESDIREHRIGYHRAKYSEYARELERIEREYRQLWKD